MVSKLRLSILVFMSLILVGCQDYQVELQKVEKPISLEKGVNENMINIYLQIDDFLCETILYRNDTTIELLKQMPLTISMKELNGNEKYYNMDKSLPSSPIKVNQIKAGDIMLFNDNCIVIFYKDFSTSYSYTKLGYIKDITEFLNRLPKNDIEVTFHKER